MAKITVTIPDDVHRAAQIRTEEQGCSVSALIVEYLGLLSGHDIEFPRLEFLQQRVQGEIDHFSARDRLDRDAVHDRAGAAIIEAGRCLDCKVVLSEDLGDGQDYAGIRVENPFRD